ncbi:MAG: 16S rRNA (cytosine(1402)-N(4))-methyltransferase RsmH [Myxococcota bacterium]
MNHPAHTTVLLRETVEAIQPRDGGVYLDVTLGLGGHAEAILEASAPSGRLLGVDRDPEALALAKARLSRFGDRVSFALGHFSEVKAHAERTQHLPADGVVADLGVSSLQLDRAERGFSFQKGGPIDMRMGPVVGETAAELIARLDVEGLAEVLREYGEVEHPRRVAQAIKDAHAEGRLHSTADLAQVIAEKSRKKPGGIHPATLAFQALRIAVNRELSELDTLLEVLPELLKPKGRAAIISFHSLEDRRVKQAFRDPELDERIAMMPVERPRGPFEALSKKPITAGELEIAHNPRARSAKLRVAERRAS